MSAAEIIELIKKLPSDQREQVRAFVNLDEKGAEDQPVRYIASDEFGMLAPSIFKDNHELLRRLAQ